MREFDKKTQTNKTFKRNILLVMASLLLLSFSLAGVTYAWFASEPDIISNNFEVGSVELSKPEKIEHNYYESINDDKQCQYVKWSFENTGTKSAYVRVLPKAEATGYETGSDTAWVGVEDGGSGDDGKYGFGNPPQAQYFKYRAGEYDKDDPLELKILSGRRYRKDGKAEIWDDGDKIFIKLETTRDGIEMTDVKYYAGLEEPDNHNQLGFSADPELETFSTDLIYSEQGGETKDFKDHNEEEINMAIKVDIDKLGEKDEEIEVNISFCPDYNTGLQWLEGSDEWWYYGSKDNGSTEKEPVEKGETVEVCFIYCVDEKYNQVEMDVSLEVEAVQSSHNAIHSLWPDNPWAPAPD